MYDGAENPSAQQAVLSSLGLYQDRGLSLIVTNIDGKSVDQTRTSEVLLLPGVHSIRIKALQDFRPGLLLSTSNNEIVEVELNAQAGHTYIPQAEIQDKSIKVFLMI